MIEITEVVVFSKRVELVPLELGIRVSRQRDCVEIGIIELNLTVLCDLADE